MQPWLFTLKNAHESLDSEVPPQSTADITYTSRTGTVIYGASHSLAGAVQVPDAEVEGAYRTRKDDPH